MVLTLKNCLVGLEGFGALSDSNLSFITSAAVFWCGP